MTTDTTFRSYDAAVSAELALTARALLAGDDDGAALLVATTEDPRALALAAVRRLVLTQRELQDLSAVWACFRPVGGAR